MGIVGRWCAICLVRNFFSLSGSSSISFPSLSSTLFHFNSCSRSLCCHVSAIERENSSYTSARTSKSCCKIVNTTLLLLYYLFLLSLQLRLYFCFFTFILNNSFTVIKRRRKMGDKTKLPKEYREYKRCNTFLTVAQSHMNRFTSRSSLLFFFFLKTHYMNKVKMKCAILKQAKNKNWCRMESAESEKLKRSVFTTVFWLVVGNAGRVMETCGEAEQEMYAVYFTSYWNLFLLLFLLNIPWCH